jgi:peptidoglycan/LPS O-acetylase OafA/YrhL
MRGLDRSDEVEQRRRAGGHVRHGHFPSVVVRWPLWPQVINSIRTSAAGAASGAAWRWASRSLPWRGGCGGDRVAVAVRCCARGAGVVSVRCLKGDVLKGGGLNQKRYDHIDSLRAFAAIGVVLFHMRSMTPGGPLPIPAWLRSFIESVGGAGVPLFFVLSAFLLSMLMPSYYRYARPVSSFYAKRFWRIAPLFYAVTAAWIIRRLYLGQPFPDLPRFLANITFTFNFFPEYANAIAFAGWTIGVEMLFYLCFPLLWKRLSSTQSKIAALLLSLPVADIAGSIIQNAFPLDSAVRAEYLLLVFFRHLPLFLMGMVAYDAYEYLRHRDDARKLGLLLFAAAIVIFTMVIQNRIAFFVTWYWQGIGSAFLIVAYCLREMPGVNRYTAFLGRISYSIYLLHGLVIVSMGTIFHQFYQPGITTVVSFALACLLALSVIVPTSWLTYALIEEPGNSIGRSIAMRLGRGSVPKDTTPASPSRT